MELSPLGEWRIRKNVAKFDVDINRSTKKRGLTESGLCPGYIFL
jgi:hypothetical protein